MGAFVSSNVGLVSRNLYARLFHRYAGAARECARSYKTASLCVNVWAPVHRYVPAGMCVFVACMGVGVCARVCSCVRFGIPINPIVVVDVSAFKMISRVSHEVITLILL